MESASRLELYCADRDETRGGHTEAKGRAALSKLLRGLAAGWGAKKLGGGCISTILIFLLLWWLLGHFQIFR
jgi:hypothetical protein